MWDAWETGEKCTRFWWENPNGKRPLEISRRRWEDGMRMGLKETGYRYVEGIQMAQDKNRWRAVVNTVENLWVLAPRS
jgi:hypothetical protein